MNIEVGTFQSCRALTKIEFSPKHMINRTLWVHLLGSRGLMTLGIREEDVSEVDGSITHKARKSVVFHLLLEYAGFVESRRHPNMDI